MVTAAQVVAEQELASLCGALNASHLRLVAIVAQALLDESWAIAGVRSPDHWLTMRAGLSPFHARQVVSVARRHAELPTVMSQFADGQLSLDQVSVIARYAPAHVEESVAELALNASVPQLRRVLSRYSFDPPAEPGHRQSATANPGPDSTGPDNNAPDKTLGNDTDPANIEPGSIEQGSNEPANIEPGSIEPSDGEPCATNPDNDTGPDSDNPDNTDPRASTDPEAGSKPSAWNGLALPEDRAGAPAELSMGYDQWGRFTLRFSAPADQGALVEAALKEAKDALFRAGRPQVTWGDAMVEVAQRSLRAATPINRRDGYRTYVHLDTEGGWLTGKPRLPHQIARKLTCDGILQPVWHTQGAPVNVGRAQRIVPARTRRLVEDRDRGCRFPGCATTAHVECHHVIHWSDGGPTDTTNLTCLCSFHHDRHHNGDFSIAGNADQPSALTFTTRSGHLIRPGPTFTTPISQTPPAPPPDSADSPGSPAPGPPLPPTPYRGPTGERLDLGWVTFSEPREPAYS
jgi:hypothetical protein